VAGVEGWTDHPRPATGSDGVCDHAGWRLYLLLNDQPGAVADELLALAHAAAEGRMGRPHHRSRRASNWRAIIGGRIELPVFVKLIEPARGLARIKRTVQGSRAANIVRITQALNDAGFDAPPVLLRGSHRRGAELLIIASAGGDGPFRTLAQLASGPLPLKRAFWRGLGREIARLHQCGFVHGDLTPFNLLVIRYEPLRLALIDHERTRRVTRMARRGSRLRNLVQLGRFKLPGVSRTDKLRVLRGYTELMNPSDRRKFERRAAAMLDHRLRRDHGLAIVAPPLSDIAPRRLWDLT